MSHSLLSSLVARLKSLVALMPLVAVLPMALPQAARADTDINVGSGPVMAVAAIQLAVAKGYFKEEGLNVTLTPLASGAATLAALVGGSLHFAPTNVISTTLARSRGIKLKIVAQESAGSSNPDKAFDGVLVRADSPMKSAKDLAGKKVAVNAINSSSTLTTSRAIEKDGGDYKSVNWVELPQGDAMTALATGSVDAVWIQEPFVTIGLKRGFKRLVSAYSQTDVNYVDSVIVSTEAYLSANPDVGKRFTRAINKALKLGAENPEEIRNMLPTYMKLDADVLKATALPVFPTQINEAGIRLQVDLATRYGYFSTPISTSDLIWKAP